MMRSLWIWWAILLISLKSCFLFVVWSWLRRLSEVPCGYALDWPFQGWEPKEFLCC